MGQKDIRLIALDLDGTLLDPDKRLSERDQQALARAAAKGIWIVPTTGRFFAGMPEKVLALPFLRYAITVNGASVYDTREKKVLRRAEFAPAEAVEIMDCFEARGVPYDCYIGEWGYMSAPLYERADEFAPDEYYRRTFHHLRTPVPEIRAYALERGEGVQKVQGYFDDPALRAELLEELPRRFPNASVTSAAERNIEINSREANKGAAMLALAKHLGLDASQTMAVGDGSNDLSMVRAAGLGIAMENACAALLAEADAVTGPCTASGVAMAIEKYCL